MNFSRYGFPSWDPFAAGRKDVAGKAGLMAVVMVEHAAAVALQFLQHGVHRLVDVLGWIQAFVYVRCPKAQNGVCIPVCI